MLPPLRLLFCFIFWCGYSFSTPIMPLEQGAISLGGNASLSMQVSNLANIEMPLKIAPSFGYFVLKQLELSTAFNLSTSLFSSAKNGATYSSVRWGPQLGLRYYFNVADTLYLYLGAAGAFSLINLRKETFLIDAILHFGLLVALSPHLGLEIGLPLKATFLTTQWNAASIDLAYVGIKGVF